MIKKSVATFALLALSAAPLAQADCGYYHDCGEHRGWHHRDDDDTGSLLAFLGSMYTLSTTSALDDDERAAYIQNVQDDAADFLAGGDESALLQEAIQTLRGQKGVTGSDAQIAARLIGQ